MGKRLVLCDFPKLSKSMALLCCVDMLNGIEQGVKHYCLQATCGPPSPTIWLWCSPWVWADPHGAQGILEQPCSQALGWLGSGTQSCITDPKRAQTSAVCDTVQTGVCSMDPRPVGEGATPHMFPDLASHSSQSGHHSAHSAAQVPDR